MSLQFYYSHPPTQSSDDLLLAFKNIIKNPSTQFFHTFERHELVTASKIIFEKFSERKTFIHIGIGGSSLGPEMLVSALKKSEVRFIFINNIDPDEIFDQLANIDISNSLFYFASKSGGTAETLAALAIITQLLKSQGIQNSDFKNYFVFATDPKKSELLILGKDLNIDMLEVPSDVGGRFCALTPVGYLPALFAGINIDRLISGAKLAQQICLDPKADNKLLLTINFLLDLKNSKNISQTVFMPYSSKLKFLSFWFTQLWAESLGKKNTGFTPIPAYGATDQHSQVQLFMEGPKDKVVILIEILKFQNDFPLTSTLSSNGLDKLSKFSLSNLMQAQLHGTIKALKEADRPYIHLAIDENNEENLGSLIIFFESLTALMGHCLAVDPFNQPGVENGKIYAFEFLSQLK